MKGLIRSPNWYRCRLKERNPQPVREGLRKEAKVNERLQRMQELGQAPWVDELSREDIKSGGLEQMIDDGIVGITSNPAIFQKAIRSEERRVGKECRSRWSPYH